MIQIKQTIEALLFTSSDPVSLRRIRDIVETIQPITNDELQMIIEELKQEYVDQNRAFRLDEIAKGYVLRTCEEYSPYIQHLHNGTRKDRLSHASLEVLAIVAYRQPITRTQIDEIRGVDSSGIVYTLLERQLIESVGKLEVPGRPTLFGVTNDFMKHFGLRDLKELPAVS
jgi:segregation and condensation protein B